MTKHFASANIVELDKVDTPAGDGNSTIRTGLHHMGSVGDVDFGVWEVEPGVLDGVVEAAEVFVVLSGAATIVSDGDPEPLGVGPGDVVRLIVGQRVRWDVTETVRKVYVHP
ncbi:cupin domain-containing protein [Gordonia sp. LSe1-13]|uniref:Cupin domain-containing protein n=1 Tax=Gordonia sesuvii TaxID=3116777 RepID=A0ABU7MJS4_9ACTN|nr:cupin domain-containing protein [Gordonia sp. LSe1-13]